MLLLRRWPCHHSPHPPPAFAFLSTFPPLLLTDFPPFILPSTLPSSLCNPNNNKLERERERERERENLFSPPIHPSSLSATQEESFSVLERERERERAFLSSPPMADPEPAVIPAKRPISNPNTRSPQTHEIENHSSNLLYRSAFIAALVAVLSFFPSQAPEFFSKSILSNRSWELLHLLFVGLVISYGLFSRRNSDADPEKGVPPKPESPRSYVSSILHVSSVFDADADEPGSGSESKIQTWSSQYNLAEPAVVVAEGSNKPLSLPVRSLKSSAPAAGSLDPRDGIDGFSVSGNGSPFFSNAVDEIPRKYDPLCSEEDAEESVVLPSPIPWRSRSARMEVSADLGPLKTQSFRSFSIPSTPSPKRLSPSPSLSPEVWAKTSEDSGRKKAHHKSSPPLPPPPPPPLPAGHGSRHVSTKSFKEELKDLSRRETKRGNHSEGSSIGGGRSVRTVRWKEAQSPAESFEDSFPQKYQSEQKDELAEKVMVESDDSDDDCVSDSSDVEDASSSVVEAGADENEVDKKADEFIAKFREQIRLQRIESIKKSSGQRGLKKNPR